MKLFLEFWIFKIPTYGLCIAAGIILANVLALLTIKHTRKKLIMDDFILVECYLGLGGFLGAKLLYLLVSAPQIEWGRIFRDPDYFRAVIQGGFVFYGGLIGGILAGFLCAKLHKINVLAYFEEYIYLLPLIHAFGRLGCHMAGCCFGIPYNGPGAVVFPEGSIAPAGISLFPVQLTESCCLFLIFAVLLFLRLKFYWRYNIETYLFLYGTLRFFLENYRYDAVRGFFGPLSTSQWISLFLILCGVLLYLYHRHAFRKEAAVQSTDSSKS